MYDGTKRQPRPIQVEALKFIKESLATNDVIALNLPTGVGKSYILRAIQLKFPGTVGLVPSNSLMNQYLETYKDINYIKGKEHYKCLQHDGYSCHESQTLFKSKCPDCLITKQKLKAEEGLSTIFNPVSYFYYRDRREDAAPDVLVVDEAHKLSGMLELLVEFSFRKKKYSYPEKIPTSIELLSWINETIKKYRRLLQHNNQRSPEENKKIIEVFEKLKFIEHCYSSNSQDFIFFKEIRDYRGSKEEYLVIKPIVPPRFLLRKILDAKKIILLSATLMRHDLWRLGLSEHVFKDFPSPIPKERRQIRYSPSAVSLKFDTDPSIVSRKIGSIIERFPGVNTIVHVSYGWSRKLAPFFPKAFFNTSDNKDEILEKFKSNGGVWFASGCSEGIDLPGDLCRLVIVPIILKPNPSDPVYQKRVALSNGWLTEELETARTVIQQAGRASRGTDDFSITVILDPAFPRIINKTRKLLPRSFLESIKWDLNE